LGGAAQRHGGEVVLKKVLFRAAYAGHALEFELAHIAPTALVQGAGFPEAAPYADSEVEAVARLEHPGIVPIYDLGEVDGVPYFTMPLLTGGSLQGRLIQAGTVPDREAAGLIAQVARAVAHAHSRGVLHRDLKPANILLDADGQPHVADFGLARLMESNGSLTRTGAALGTPAYAAPEQIRGDAPTTAGDVFSLGAVLYHTLTGRAPFVGPILDSILLQLRETEPVPPRRLNPTVPPDLETICLKCLEKAPERRYVSAAALAEDLRRFLMGEVLLARPVGLPGKAVRWCRQRPALAGLAAAFFLAAALGTGGVIYQWRRAERKAAAEVWQRELAQKGERAARLRTYTAGVFADGLSSVGDEVHHDLVHL
jgi:serine/threonine-protein kinase